MKLAVIIPAAGGSTRFGTKDKLAEDLGGRPLLLRTVEFFTKREDVSEIVVAGSPKDYEGFKERFGPSLSFHGVKLVKGGDSRTQSVAKSLKVISDEITHVAIHDSARPAINNNLFDRVLLASNDFDAVAAALPISGTIKRVSSSSSTIADEDAIADSILGTSSQVTIDAFQINETIDRTNLWEMQTPQCFELSLLKRAYEQDNLNSFTDDAQVVENLGEPVYVIKGDSRNIKVTNPSDIHLVKAILGVKGAPERPAHKRF
jgi:2-C-methyl-D-erythritol 4-phosphate cytidylyltransferase